MIHSQWRLKSCSDVRFCFLNVFVDFRRTLKSRRQLLWFSCIGLATNDSKQFWTLSVLGVAIIQCQRKQVVRFYANFRVLIVDFMATAKHQRLRSYIVCELLSFSLEPCIVNCPMISLIGIIARHPKTETFNTLNQRNSRIGPEFAIYGYIFITIIIKRRFWNLSVKISRLFGLVGVHHCEIIL